MASVQLKSVCFLVFTVNFIIAPWLLNVDRTGKAVFFLAVALILFLFFSIESFPPLTVISLLSILSLTTLYSPGSQYVKLPYFAASAIFIFYVFFVRSEFLKNIDITRKCLFATVSLLTVLTAALGLYEYFSFVLLGPNPGMLIPYLMPENPNVRVGGIFGQPNLFATLLLLGVFVFIYQYLHTDEFNNHRYSGLKYLPFVLVLVVFFLTRSRSAYLSFLLCYLFLCLALFKNTNIFKIKYTKKRFWRITGFILLSYFLFIFLDFNYTDFSAVRPITSNSIPTEARFIFWISALFIYLDYPLFGVGLDNFKMYLPKYLNLSHDFLGFVQYEAMGYTDWAHNEFFQLMCEGGTLLLLPVLTVLLIYIAKLTHFLKSGSQFSPLFLYSHVFLLPFLIQSNFSWTMRHPALLVMFSTFVAFLLAQYSLKSVVLGTFGRQIVRAVSFCFLLGLVVVVFWEVKAGLWSKKLNAQTMNESYNEFVVLVSNPYLEYTLLHSATPRYVKHAVRENDLEFAEKMIPYVEKLTMVQGAHWQWYNLAILFQLLNHTERSISAIRKAIELQPTKASYWDLLHYINVLEASRATGKPVGQFVPFNNPYEIDPAFQVKELVESFRASD